MGLYGNQELTGVERFFDDDEIIVTKTDLAGKLTYGNRTFYKLAGYTEEECIGQQHNIIRHPEMPRTVFDLLWKTLEQGNEIFAYVNNRSKNGDFYWVLAHVTPSLDVSGNIVGYHSNRRVPNPRIIKDHINPLYAELMQIERNASGPKEGIQKGYEKVLGILNETKMEFNELMFSLGS